MANLPIPSDWDKKTWQCVTVQIPRSQEYRALITGLIYSMTRGRIYDESTGSVKDAQKIGWWIWDRNYPLATCGAGNTPSKPTDDTSAIYSLFAGCNDDCQNEGCNSEECDGMTCCITDIRIENGMLQKLVCGEWRDIGSIASVSQPDDDSTATTPETPELQDSFSCAKATAIVELLWATMYAGWDHYNDAPWAVIKNIQSAAGVDLHDNYIGMMIVAIIDANATETDLHDIVENVPKQEAICRMAGKIDGTVSELTDADWEHIKGMRDWLSTDALEWAYIDVTNDAIGRNNYDRAGRMACLDATFDCRCPGQQVIIPVESDWVHVYDLWFDDYAWVTDNGAYEEGIGFANRSIARYDYLPMIRRTVDLAGGQSAVLKYLVVELDWPSCDTYAADYLVQCGVTTVNFGEYKNVAQIALPVTVNIGYGNEIRVMSGQCTAVATSGDAVLKRVIIAGTGDDPFPADEV